MNHIFKALIILSCLVILSTNSLASTSNKLIDLKIEITGVPNTTGALEIIVMNSETQFSGDATEYLVIRKAAQLGKNRFLIPQLPAGEYAIVVYHDENNNRELDENWRGIPQEAFGFSGNHTRLLEDPSFSDMRVKVNASENRIQINLIRMD
ncbi:MAG: DUF2141 domain-containing protein [Kangiellaceae bacterium]|nr:DUF2141 domain-containing protein [Kangiellaceae bacterium]MCW8999952.1 DUF2141 domain-containing protein [Kangiellaceae bacterium]MCW9018460.1 DUF2141 domain-containing protein [Kangiellaceae bacterium]